MQKSTVFDWWYFQNDSMTGNEVTEVYPPPPKKKKFFFGGGGGGSWRLRALALETLGMCFFKLELSDHAKNLLY